MLPVVCDLQSESVVVLPNIETDLTLLGPNAPTTPPAEQSLLSTRFAPFEEIGILLIIHNGLPLVPTEFTLWTWTVGVEFVRLEPPASRKFVIPLPNVPLKSAAGTLPSVLVPIKEVEFVQSSPPVALQVIITILLNSLELDPSIIPTVGPTVVLIPRTFIKEITIAPVAFGIPKTANPFLTLAMVFSAAFPINIDVLTTGLPPLLVNIAFEIADARVTIFVFTIR